MRRPTCSSSCGRATPDAAPAPPTGFPLRFDVRVVAPSTLRVDNNVLRMVLSADLHVPRHVRQAAAVRPRRDRARRGPVRGQALRRHPRHDRLQQPVADRAVLRPRGARRASACPARPTRSRATVAGTMRSVPVGAQLRPAAAEHRRALAAAERHRARPIRSWRSCGRRQQTEQQLLQARAAQLLVEPDLRGRRPRRRADLRRGQRSRSRRR